jgi:hypothetical protein
MRQTYEPFTMPVSRAHSSTQLLNDMMYLAHKNVIMLHMRVVRATGPNICQPGFY